MDRLDDERYSSKDMEVWYDDDNDGGGGGKSLLRIACNVMVIWYEM